MIRFAQTLNEDKGGKNLHLEHLEDEIINFGVDGGRAAINFLRSLRDMLAGASRSSINMTVKWDGAPAIFAGIDPEDNKFFVAKKSVFNVNPKQHAQGYVKWIEMSLQKQIDKAKSVKGKDKYSQIQKEYVREVNKHTNNLVQVITFQNYLVDAKMQIVKKLNSVKGLTDTFVKTSNGFKVTNPEGYVAIDRVSGGAVKLVDRMEFSFNNFTAIKAWDK